MRPKGSQKNTSDAPTGIWAVGTLRCGILAGVLALSLPAVAYGQNIDQDNPGLVSATTPAPQTPTVLLDTATPAIPSAQEIIVNLPSARHTSRYQRGEVNGLRYVLLPNGSGRVMQAADSSAVLFRLNCTAGVSCNISGGNGPDIIVPAVDGAKPVMPTAPDGAALTRYLAEWILADTPPAPVLPQEEVVASQLAQAPTEPAQKTTLEAAPMRKATTMVKARPKTQINKQQTAKRTPARTFTAVKPLKEKPIKVAAAPSRGTPQEQTLFQRMNLSCSVTGSVTLRYRNHKSGSERFGKPRASLGCGAKLTDKLSLRVSVIGYADRHEKSPSDAEFTYALTYRATDKITLSYSNYSGLFGSSDSGFSDSLKSGTLRASYKLPRISLPNDKSIGCSASIGLLKPKETTANLTCSYAVTDRFRVSATAYAYFPDQQESWDADFAYTASYKINDDWRVSYSNYANNRFFWNKSSSPRQGILGGTLSISRSFKF